MMQKKMSARRSLTLCLFLCLVVTVLRPSASLKAKRVGEIDIDAYRERVRRMFYHAYEGYLAHAYPFDELQPITCAGHDTWGSYSLTLIDAMDTLAVMGNYSEFRRIAQILIDKGESFFDIDINVSVFETNIRIVGGLLSAHLLMKRAGMALEPAWPCSGPLLRMADNIARKILPAFDTATGMPYGTVNLQNGVPKGETTVTCTAGIGTFIIEFGTLSRLTGDPIFEKTAIRAIRALWKYRSPLGLLGNHIDVSNGKWTAQDSGIGGGIDSYFEYLVKGAIMFNIPELLHMFKEYEVSLKKYLKRDDWYMWAQMTKGTISLPLFTSLDGYWPSIKGMLGDLDEAMKTMHNFHQVWRQFGFTPEYYNILKADVHAGREGYPLRPEVVESTMYLYRATKDPYLLEMGVDIVEAIEHSARTSCGYATVKDVRDHLLEDRMESFFLAETTKYLYLLFDPENFIHNNGSHGDVVNTPSGACVIEAGGYIFNTEAHPLDLAAVHCCSAAKQEENKLLQEIHDNLDLLSLLDIVDEDDNDWIETQKKKKHMKKKETAADKLKSLPDEDENDDTVVCDKDEELKVSDDVFASTDASPDQEKAKKKHHLHVVDMTSFTEAERNITRIFMEEQKMDSILKKFSQQIAEKLQRQYKDTEYEHLAFNAARKILEAGTENSGNITSSSSEVNKEIDKNSNNDNKDNSNLDSENDKAKERVKTEIKEQNNNKDKEKNVEPASESKTVELVIDDKRLVDTSGKKEPGFSTPDIKITITKSDGTQEIIQQSVFNETSLTGFTKKIDNKQEETTLTSTQTVTTTVNIYRELVERFKSHIQDQIQHQDNQKLQDSQKSAPLAHQADGPPTSLENKRTNLLSLTTKILKLFSGEAPGTSKDSSEAETRTPNLADLYTSLANYPLRYFHDPSVMHCPARSFHSRISVYGEMFPED